MTPTIPERIVTFTQGLPGFESSRRFVLIASPTIAPFTLLQGSGDDAPSFVGVDPRRIDPAYPTALDPDDLMRLGAGTDDPLLWLALITATPGGPATANLRAPIVINPVSMRGIQRLSADSAYRLDHPLSQD